MCAPRNEGANRMYRLFGIILVALLPVAGAQSANVGPIALTDASGEWMIRHEKSAVGGIESCFVQNRAIKLYLLRLKSGGSVVMWDTWVGNNHFPGEPIYLNIGGQIFTTEQDHFAVSTTDEIVAALKRGGDIVTEWSDWPHRRKHKETGTTGDVAAKIAICEDLIR